MEVSRLCVRVRAGVARSPRFYSIKTRIVRGVLCFYMWGSVDSYSKEAGSVRRKTATPEKNRQKPRPGG